MEGNELTTTNILTILDPENGKKIDPISALYPVAIDPELQEAKIENYVEFFHRFLLKVETVEDLLA